LMIPLRNNFFECRPAILKWVDWTLYAKKKDDFRSTASTLFNLTMRDNLGTVAFEEIIYSTVIDISLREKYFEND